MNSDRLKQAQADFLKRYPKGFENEELKEYGKKFKMDKHQAFAKERFAKKRFEDPTAITSDMATLVSRSAMVSMFEKPKFKGVVKDLSGKHAEPWASALYDALHGKKRAGFEALVALLARHKLAKWTLATVFLAYYRPNKELFVKPSTAKLVIKELELPLTYQSRPDWELYRDLRKEVLALRKLSSPSLAPSNAAFMGFLMMTLGDKRF